VGTGPSRRRIGRRDELRHDIGRSAKGRIVEHSYIFFDRPAGIDRKGFPPTGPSGMQRPQDCLEDAPPPQSEVSF
jgi:hypothetical protein